MCSPHITSLHLHVTSERWQMADWPDSQENPFRVTPGSRSDVTTTSAAGSSRRPGTVVRPVGGADPLPPATAGALEEAMSEK